VTALSAPLLRSLALIVAFATLPTHAILIRPDRSDEEYRELATRYDTSVILEAPDGEGVLIAPRWVLTAAHMAKALQEMKALPKLTFAGKAYEIQGVFIHPDWKKGGPGDIALLQLKIPVEGVEPTPIYREKDEGGKTVVIVGHGYTGKIGEKPLPKEKWDRKKRAAINTITKVTPRILGLEIKAGDDASDLQGAAGPGDSGGPAYVEVNDELFVIGIGYATDDTNADGIIGNVGDWELYVRVSAYAGWIDQVTAKAATDETAAILGPTDKP
jgi:Trypsin